MGPTGRKYHVVSADSHILEPPDLWEKWMPKKYQGLAPKVVRHEVYGDVWQYPDRPPPRQGLGMAARVGTRYEDIKKDGGLYGDGIHPSCYEGKARLEVMDVDGVDAEALYGSGGIIYWQYVKDPEAQLAGVEAYNRWLIEDFCAADPARLIALAYLPNLGVETAVAHLRNAKEMGFRGWVLSHWPSGKENISREDDPLWAAAEELDMPGGIHIQVGPRHFSLAEEARWAMGADTLTAMPTPMTELIFTGVYDRFPGLRTQAVETGVGWIPFFLEMMDDRYWRNRTWAKATLKKLPSQYFRDNWLATFITDKIGVQMRHAVGVDNMAWSTDFPHHGNDWPYSRKVIDEHFVNVPADEKDKIICTNAAKLYGLI